MIHIRTEQAARKELKKIHTPDTFVRRRRSASKQQQDSNSCKTEQGLQILAPKASADK
jgi:hypothetical protein